MSYKLAERLENPHVPSAALSGAVNVYKIKLRQAGYRLVYSVEDKTVTVTVIAVGKSDRNEVYDLALSRLQNSQEPSTTKISGAQSAGRPTGSTG